MTNEVLDTTNKLITPKDVSTSDDEVIRQLSENLQDITPDDVESMCEEIAEKEVQEKVEKEEKLEENGGFEIIGEADGSDIEYNESKRIVKWKGDVYDLNSFLGIRKFLDSVRIFINEEQLGEICTKIGI